MKSNFFLVLCVATCFIACKQSQEPQKTDTSVTPSIVIETQLLEKKGGPCKDDNDNCAKISASYPFATKGLPHVTQMMNNTIQESLIGMICGGMVPEGQTVKTIEEAAQLFLDTYQSALTENPEYTGSWSNEVSSVLNFLSGEVASIQMDNFSYSGGAHPNTYSAYLVFDVKTGKTLSLVDLVPDTTSLKPMLVEAFKKTRELPPSADLQAAGYFWDGPFTFPANVGITKDGLLFYYNNYEAASYAEGPTAFEIPFKALEGKLNPAYFPVRNTN